MGYIREDKNKWYHTRFIAYQVYTSTPIKGQHISIEKFMNLDNNISKLSHEQKELLRELNKKAVKEAKDKANE